MGGPTISSVPIESHISLSRREGDPRAAPEKDPPMSLNGVILGGPVVFLLSGFSCVLQMPRSVRV
jgi:hypothetical protein